MHPDEVDAVGALIDNLAFGERGVHDHRLATKTGGWLWVRNHVVRGGGDWVLAIVRDITVERERELSSENARQTAALLRDTAGVTVWRYNADTDEYDLNPDFTRPADAPAGGWKLSGGGVRPAVHRQDAAALHLAWTRSLVTGEANLMDYRERTAGRGWRHVRAAWQGVRPLASGRWEVLGIAQDITALVEARDAAVRGEQAALLVEAKARFLLAAGHEDPHADERGAARHIAPPGRRALGGRAPAAGARGPGVGNRPVGPV